MKVKVQAEVAEYSLRSFQDPGKWRPGYLLRVTWPDGVTGFADLHPWPELGDPPLEFCRREHPPLWQRALGLARLDGEARRDKRLLVAKPLPSHRLVRDLQADLPVTVTRVKIKCGGDLARETARLKPFFARLRAQQKVRLDFNGALTADAFAAWMEAEQSWLLDRLDFIEDPFASGDAPAWRRFIAYDRVAIPDGVEAAVKIVKPVREDIESDPHFLAGRIQRIVFTHNMDHPLGQRAARVCASMFYDEHPAFLEPGGLDFFDGYHLPDNALAQPQTSETGLGLDQYLADRSWQPA